MFAKYSTYGKRNLQKSAPTGQNQRSQSYFQCETFEKCSFLFKFKDGEPPPNFGGLTTGIHLVFRGLKFEPDPPEFFGGGKKGCFAKVSCAELLTFL